MAQHHRLCKLYIKEGYLELGFWPKVKGPHILVACLLRKFRGGLGHHTVRDRELKRHKPRWLLEQAHFQANPSVCAWSANHMIRTPSAPLLTLMIGTGFQHEFQSLLLGHAADKRSTDLDCNNIFQDIKSSFHPCTYV